MSGVDRVVGEGGLTGVDLSLSYRHKLWGDDCPACDVDALTTGQSNMAPLEWPAVEYAHGDPAALIEYKAVVGPSGIPLSATTMVHPSTRAFLAIPTTIPVGISIYQATEAGAWNWYVPRVPGMPDTLMGNKPFVDAMNWWIQHEGIQTQETYVNDTIPVMSLGEINWVRFLYHLRSLKHPSVHYPPYVQDQILTGRLIPKERRVHKSFRKPPDPD